MQDEGTRMATPASGIPPSPAEIAARLDGFAAWFEIDLDAVGRNLDRLSGGGSASS